MTSNCGDMLTPVEGIRFSRINSVDYGLRLLSREANPPHKKRIVTSLPYMQGEYDFSRIMGEDYYDQRELKYTFLVVDYNYHNRNQLDTILANWLIPGQIQALYDTAVPGYYYKAQCVDYAIVDMYHGMQLELTFNAYPFKITIAEEGDDIWDTFNFELDVSQLTQYQIDGTVDITLYNVGISRVCPLVDATAPMTIQQEDKTFNVPTGTGWTAHDFFLNPKNSANQGANLITVSGHGTITFHFFRELL